MTDKKQTAGSVENNDISALYARTKTQAPSAQLDAKIMAMAANELSAYSQQNQAGADPKIKRRKKAFRTWPVSGSIAASFIVAAIYITTIPKPLGVDEYTLADTQEATRQSDDSAEYEQLRIAAERMRTEAARLETTKRAKAALPDMIYAEIIAPEVIEAELAEAEADEITETQLASIISKPEADEVLIEELPFVTKVPERNLSEEIELSYAALIGFGYKELDNRGGNKISSLVAQTESKMARAPEKISVIGARVLSSSNDEGVLSDKDINTRTAKKPENTFQEQQTQLFELLLKQKQQPAQRNSWQLAHKYRKVLTKEQIQILEAKPIEQ